MGIKSGGNFSIPDNGTYCILLSLDFSVSSVPLWLVFIMNDTTYRVRVCDSTAWLSLSRIARRPP